MDTFYAILLLTRNIIVSSASLLYVLTADLVWGRHFWYFFHIFNLLIIPCLTAFFDSVDITDLPVIIGRRLFSVCALPVILLWLVGRVEVARMVFIRTLLWPLPGLLLYLMKLCFVLSREIDAGGAKGSLYPLFPLLTASSFYPLWAAQLSIASMGGAILLLSTIGLHSLWRRARRRGNRVQTIVSTPPSGPNVTIGNAAPSHESADEGRRDREEAMEAGPLTTVVPGMIEAIGNDEDQLDGDETEDEHENRTQLDVAEETEIQGSPAFESDEAVEAGQLAAVVPGIVEAITNDRHGPHDDINNVELQVREDEPPQLHPLTDNDLVVFGPVAPLEVALVETFDDNSTEIYRTCSTMPTVDNDWQDPDFAFPPIVRVRYLSGRLVFNEPLSEIAPPTVSRLRQMIANRIGLGRHHQHLEVGDRHLTDNDLVVVGPAAPLDVVLVETFDDDSTVVTRQSFSPDSTAPTVNDNWESVSFD